MGGEVPLNQSDLDRQCVPKAGRAVMLATAIGVNGTILLAYGLWAGLRGRSRPPRRDL